MDLVGRNQVTYITSYTAKQAEACLTPARFCAIKPRHQKWAGLRPNTMEPNWRQVCDKARPKEEFGFLWSVWHNAVAVGAGRSTQRYNPASVSAVINWRVRLHCTGCAPAPVLAPSGIMPDRSYINWQEHPWSHTQGSTGSFVSLVLACLAVTRISWAHLVLVT